MSSSINSVFYHSQLIRNKFRRFYDRHRLGFAIQPQKRNDLVRLGSDYGGWTIPSGLLHQSSVCYCVGAGEDISFDLSLISSFGCDVYTFDPTPRSIAYVTGLSELDARLHFIPVGVWNQDAFIKFYAPQNPSHVSHSIVNLQQTSDYFDAKVKRLSTLMQELGHSRIDLLKIDIEGAEYDVLIDICKEGIDVRCICVEYDRPIAWVKAREAFAVLEASGYVPVHRFRTDVTYLRE